MKALVSRFTNLLSSYIPEVIDSLNGPATEEEIKLLEETIGTSLPEEVRELYKIHNGQKGEKIDFFCGLSFLSIQDALKEWSLFNNFSTDLTSQFDDSIISIPMSHIREVYISRGNFPLSKDGGGNKLCLDLDPDIAGTKGQLINTGPEEQIRYVIATGVADFFKFLIEQLENGNIRVAREYDYISWYLKSPSNSHFLDTLPHLDLPYGHPIVEEDQPAISFEDWKNGLEEKWKKVLTDKLKTPSNWKELRKIKKLYLSKYDLSDIRPISKFTGLRELILHGKSITNLVPLKSLVHLRTLYLSMMPNTSIEAILELPNLTKLSLSRIQLTKLDNISALKKLKTLNIASSSITDLEEIGKLENLTNLDVNNNEFQSFEPLKKLKKLTQLNLSSTNIKNLEVIRELENLTILNLTNNEIQSFEPLRNLKKLTQLNLSNTNIKSLEAISELPYLDSLIIYKTAIEDYAPLASLEQLNSIKCTFEEFLKIKDITNSKVRISVIGGGMTPEQKTYYYNYMRNNRS